MAFCALATPLCVPYALTSRHRALVPPSHDGTRWENFYQGSQRAYLAKDEYVTGAYGIEGRFPFLDARVVQEQLYLAPDLKNTYYKAAAQLYMKKYGYPVEPCVATPAHPFGEGAGCKKVGFLVPSRPRKVGATSGCIGPACKPWF